MRALRYLLALAAIAGTAGAQASTVTYTFTEYDDNGGIAYQLRHSLDHFLASGEDVDFGLADIVVDPYGAGGTKALQQGASDALPTFGGTGSFITFGGAVFCHVLPGLGQGCDPGDRFFAFSYDMNVNTPLANDPTGTWIDSSQTGFREQLDVAVSTDGGTPNRTPEPGPAALLALALAALGLTRLTRA